MKKVINGIIITLCILLIGFVEIFSMLPNIVLNTSIIIGAFVIPICIIFVTMIIQIKKTKDMQEKESIRKFWLKTLFIIYLLLLVTVLFSKSEYRMNGIGNANIFSKEHFETINIVPFSTIISYITKLISNNINTSVVVINIVINLILFAPMGLFIPLLFKEKIDNIKKFVLLIIISSLMVELLQFLTYRGATDIDDIILNTIGATIVYVLMQTRLVKNMLLKIMDIPET